MQPYLADPDARVRRAAIATLTETAPPGVGIALAAATGDEHGTVRHAAATGLRELVEVLPAADETFLASLRAALASADAVIRAAAIDVLRQLGAGDGDVLSVALADADHRVRLQAVRGLVSLGEAGLVASAAADPSREVRIGVAVGLGTLASAALGTLAGTGPGTLSTPQAGLAQADLAQALARLADDTDPLVRAAAFKAAGAAGCSPPFDARAASAVTDPAWEVRAGAAQALASAIPEVAIAPLVTAAADPHPDVRKSAVIALSSLAAHPEAADALRTAAELDTDADVRAYARQAKART
jgi:HEAT repeat protein